jgi:hypothetical protein
MDSGTSSGGMSNVIFDELATFEGSLGAGVGVVDSDFSTAERRLLETDLRGCDISRRDVIGWWRKAEWRPHKPFVYTIAGRSAWVDD